MKILGIIAEYNPFHNGHKYHLEESRRLTGCDYCVCVMSGNFLQRGEPAIFDKWTRAEIAVRNGIDLVIELPFAYACNNAEYFAKGAIGILNGLGCVTDLTFGSETGNKEQLFQAAKLLLDEDPEFSALMKKGLKMGYSYPRARYDAYRKLEGSMAAEVLESPNNILGVEYIRHCLALNSTMEISPIKRIGTGYSDIKVAGSIASATAIRHMLLEENKTLESITALVPEQTFKTLESNSQTLPVGFEDFFRLFVYKIASTSSDELSEILSVTEGLENRLKMAAMKSGSARMLVKNIKSKRYTETRIQRMLMHILFNLTKSGMRSMEEKGGALYARVLAMNTNGARLIKSIKKTGSATIPLITNINREAFKYPEISNMIDMEILASDIYNMVSGRDTYNYSDHVIKPYKLDIVQSE